MKPTEQESFSARLRASMQSAKLPSMNPTAFARQFNARYAGTPITPYAARKWLLGEAIPTQEKLVVLAKWLGVSPEWLRFDGTARREPAGIPLDLDGDSGLLVLVDAFRRLSRENQQILLNTAEVLIFVQHWRDKPDG